MQEIFYILAKSVAIALEVASFAMIIRMILPFFIEPTESRLYVISFCVTEPFIIPVRAAMEKLNIGQDSPIDWAFFVTYILMTILGSMMPVI